MKQIEKFNTSPLLVGACAEFHNEMLTLILAFSLGVLKIEDLVPAYELEVSKLNQTVNRSQKLANTRLIIEHDRIRDRLITRFFRMVKDLKKSPIAEEKRFGEILWDAISQYEGMAKNEMNKETNEVRGMLRDLEVHDLNEIVLNANLGPLRDQIQYNNDAVSNLMSGRNEAETEKGKINTLEQRKVVTDLYNQIVLRVNAVAALEEIDEVNAFIDRVNTLIEAYRRVISHMRPGGTGNEKVNKKETPEPQPEQPEETENEE